MFGRDPRLPIDRLLEIEETQGHQPSSWTTQHQTELRDAHQRAAARLAKEADTRKKRFDRHSRTKVTPIEVGHRVLVRDRTICGRNKVQDRWSTRVHKVVKQLDNGAYVIKPADGRGNTRVVNRQSCRCALHLCCRGPLKRRGSDYSENHYRQTHLTTTAVLGLQLTLYHHHVLQQNLILMSQAVMETLMRVLQMIQELSVGPVRCSTRSTAGHHSNRYNLLMSVLKK